METKTEPVKVEKAVFEEFVYELKSVNKDEYLDLNEKSKIFLIINDRETNIPLNKLFLENRVEIDSEDFTGFSVLKMVKNNKLKIDANTILDIAFIDKTSGKKFHIVNIRRPFIVYDDDIEAKVETRLAFIDLLLSGNVAGGSVPSANTPTPEQVEAEAKAAAEAERVEKEKAEAEAKEKAEAEAKEKQEAELAAIEAANKKLLGGGEWEAKRRELLDDGFKEYKKYDYRFFYNGDEIEFFALEPGDFVPVELSEEEITEEKEVYSFEDANEDDWVVTLNKKTDKLTIKESEE